STDDVSSLLAEPGGLEAGPRRLRVGVGVHRENGAADEILYQVERTARGGVIGVHDPAHPEWRGHRGVGADERRSDLLDQIGHACQRTDLGGPTTHRGRKSPGTAAWRLAH